MKIESKKLGFVTVPDERIITFPKGLMGFSSLRQFAILTQDENDTFVWLVPVDDPMREFVITYPSMWIPGYEQAIPQELLNEIGSPDDGKLSVMVVVNKYHETYTANLAGPILINLETRIAAQVVMTDRRWPTRHPLLTFHRREVAAS